MKAYILSECRSPAQFFFITILVVFLLQGCSPGPEISFSRYTIVKGEAAHWWARSHADVNGDGLIDFFVVHENASGGWLGWYETVPGYAPSIKHIIADTSVEGGTFAAGDLASGDIDNDGDIDVLGPVSPGEWGGSSEPCRMYWYENPTWEAHYIGIFPSLVKDMDLVDFNNDGKLDLAGTCFDARQMIVFRQDAPAAWTQVAGVTVETLHEGQHVGDLDGDGFTDVVSTAFWFRNPGGDLTGAWEVGNIDPYWNTDEGRTWEYNATKIICRDIDGDGMDEVFISCSEKFRDRVAWYDPPSGSLNGEWKMHPIGRNTFAHTLQVADVEGDGDYDVLSGNNAHQGDPEDSPVILFLNEGNNLEWNGQVLDSTGAYNSFLVDVEGDGDMDLFRYRGHESDSYELWINEIVSQ